MAEDTLVRVEHLAKKFCRDLKTSLWYGVQDLGAEFVGKKKEEDIQLRNKEFWAVRDINFELKRGECLGLIGRNGAGKSTLLKMLNGLIKPDKGRIEMYGRIGALIELGSGFNPILTGRENIYNNGSVLGLNKKEIDGLLEEIIDFSEMEKFIDTPVQYYSSGMKVRLGFSVAAHMKPDVLILDEVLAVGDSGFKIKSFNKINEIMRDAAVIFVSHSMPHIANITNKVLLMENGVVDYYGENITDGIERYFGLFAGDKERVEYNEFATIEDMKVYASAKYADDPSRKLPAIDYRDPIRIDLDLKLKPNVEWFHIKLQITDKDLKIVGIYDSFQFQEAIKNDRDLHHLKITIPNSIFIDGEYSITVFIQQRDPINSKWNLLAVYRYWRKFNMKASAGLGYVPAVVYLPGQCEVV
ncbi:ABC transporter ATP-binding protein [Cryomorpha ignava]|uniref:ABC transporter ATP-binding protein n=1 Tax=Cryomorpha ignava TaxID=101383 RepID=A0A7K3WST8_9FLAO|nr:ABC transporter ATP-binding protein [Cryomorpha ignava]NEN24526.1 ABC transporter ATP-binding protein [Cryomorpha ignava]